MNNTASAGDTKACFHHYNETLPTTKAEVVSFLLRAVHGGIRRLDERIRVRGVRRVDRDSDARPDVDALLITTEREWFTKSNNDFPGAAVVNNVALKGVGAALGWTGRDGASVRVTWARRIGSNPNPTVTGLDQDGSKVRNRIWVAAAFSF